MDEKTTRKSMKYSVYDGASFAVMEGATSSFMTPFAVALNASVNMIAAMSYIPQLAGAFMQLFAARIVEIVRDRKKILVYSSFIHALLWIPMLLIPYATPNQKYLIIVYMALQTIVSNLMNPVGNAFLGDIVPVNERGRFFGLRNKVVGISTFISALLAGLLLNYFSPKNPIIGFTILFSVAFAARALSGVFKFGMTSPETQFAHEDKFSLKDFVKRMNKTNYGHFVIYMMFFKFAVNIAAPFFAVYMLKDLGFTYIQFTIVMAVELMASFLTMGIWGKMIDEKGTKSVLYITGILTPIIPFLWLFSGNFYYIILIELFSGAAWAGFNLSTSNFIFDAVKPENRVRCITYFKFFEGIALFAGAAVGGLIISYIPHWIFLSSISFVFLISGILRIIPAVTMMPTLHEARLIELDIGDSFFKRFVRVKPSEGIVVEVIGKYNKNYVSEKKKIQTKTAEKKQEKKPVDYNKKLLKFIDKSITPKKEKHDINNIHDIERITEDIKKGKVKK